MSSSSSQRFIRCMYAVSLLLVLNSCQGIASLLYGVEKPKVIDSDELLEAARSIDLDTSKVYSLTYDGFIDRTFKNGRSTVNIEIFNDEGYLVLPNDSTILNCTGRIANYLKTLDNPEYYYLSDSIMVQDYLQGLVTFDGTPLDTLPLDNADFTAVINWARYAGKLNNEIGTWTEVIHEHDSVNFNIIYVNLDLQEFWGDVPMLK